MNVKIACLVVGLVGLSGGPSPAQPGPAPEDLRSLLADPKGGEPIIAKYEYDLELRRAGGPRSESVQRLLRVLYQSNDPTWPALLEESCRRGIVDCNDYLAMAADFGRKQPSKVPGRAAQYPAVPAEAELQRLGVAGRHELYRKILSTPGLKDEATGMSPADAGIRAIQEGMYDLVPLVEGTEARWRGASKEELHLQLVMVHALTSSNPPDELLILVSQGVDRDISYQLAPKARRWPVSCNDLTCAAAVHALSELRRRNPTGVSLKLKELLSRYDVVRARVESSSKETAGAAEKKEHPGIPESRPSPSAYLGSVGPKLAMLIGDLGDRGTERKALGGKTLWDKVFEVEHEMVNRSLLKESEIVATAPR